MERKLAAILAADVVGYSRLITEDEARTLDALRALRRELFEPVIAEHRGEVVKRMGDGWLVSFASVVDAAQCAIQVQERLAGHDRIKLRIGVHLGDIVHEDEDIYGDGVNIAARLQEVAEPGSVMISGTAYESVIGRMDSQFEDAGEQPLKNIARPVRIWRWKVNARASQPAQITGLAHGAFTEKPSIVVLPFENRSSDPEQEYFSDGITDDIITEVSRFSRLLVIARNTSFTFKGKNVDVRQVAADLGVDFVLEGAVRRAGNKVRITVQLVDGSTGAQIWAERYEDQLEDVFDLQQRITEQVVGTMVPFLETAEMLHVERGERRYSEADDLALRGQKRVHDFAINADGAAALVEAADLARRAVEVDPSCARGWQVLSSAWTWRVFRGDADDRELAIRNAKVAAERLVDLAPHDAASFRTRGVAAMHRGEWAESLVDVRRAYDLNPNDTAVITLAFCEARAGNTERAKELADRALRITPHDNQIGSAYLAKAMCAFIDGDFENLRHWSELAIQAQPRAPIRRVLMAVYAIELADEKLKNTHLNVLKEITPSFIGNIFSGLYRPFIREEHVDRLLDILRKGGLEPK